MKYNPKIHKKLTRDHVISVVRGKDKVGVYWKGTDGRDILFETDPLTADRIIKIFNHEPLCEFHQHCDGTCGENQGHD